MRPASALRCALIALVVALGAALMPSSALAAPVGGKLQVRHVFVIVLENESAAVTFGPNSPAPYLSKTLPARGATSRGGVLRVTLDGHTQTLHLRSRALHRRRVLYSAAVKPGVHHLWLVDVRGLVALEGLAIASRTG